jgi:hypothetical protein
MTSTCVLPTAGELAELGRQIVETRSRLHRRALMQYLAVFGRGRSGHDAPPRGVRERESARRTEYQKILPMRLANSTDRALIVPLTTGSTIKRVTNWAKLGQFPSWIKLAAAKVDVDLAAATMETHKPLGPFENGGIGGRDGAQVQRDQARPDAGNPSTTQ